MESLNSNLARGRSVFQWADLYGLVTFGFAILLLIAAGLKAESESIYLVSPNYITHGGAFLPAATIVIECALGGWLLSGIARTWARRVTIAILVVFIAIASWRFSTGADDCGCFGRVKVHPAATMVLDVGALCAFWYLGRREQIREEVLNSPGPIRLLAATFICVALPLLVAARADLVRSPSVSVVLLEPGQWTGHRCPLLDYLLATDANTLARGRHAVILYDSHCGKCQDYLKRRGGSGAFEPPIIIDISTNPLDGWEKHSGGFRELHVRPGAELVSSVPTEFLTTEGVVTQVIRSPSDVPE